MRRSITVDHDHIDPSVIIDVAESGSSAGGHEELARASARELLLEPAIGQALPKQVGLREDIVAELFALPAHASIGLEEIDLATLDGILEHEFAAMTIPRKDELETELLADAEQVRLRIVSGRRVIASVELSR